MIWLVWLTPRNNLGMRKVRPFVVRVKGIPLYLVLYSLNGKNPTGAVRTKHRTGLTVKHRFRLGFRLFGFANYLISRLAARRGYKALGSGGLGKTCRSESTRGESWGQLHNFGAVCGKGGKAGRISVLSSQFFVLGFSFFVHRSSFFVKEFGHVESRDMRREARFLFLSAIFLSFIVPQSSAIELKAKTREAFDRYVQLTEERMKSEGSQGKQFLAIDTLGPDQKSAAMERLRKGEVVIDRRQMLENGKPIDVPDGLIHHWMGIVFIPGTTLKKTLALQQDYDHHAQLYAPNVTRSKLVSRNGDVFKIAYRVRQKKVITVVMDTDYDVLYEAVSATRERSRSYSTRIQEIENAGEPSEHAKPVDDGNGFMWRLYSYWRMEERDGGVYVQCEAVSLSRDIPTGLGWMIKGYVESVPRESLMFTLGKTREALMRER